MAKIDRVEDLPEWFSLEKYRGCELFDAREWYRQLLERRSLINVCREMKDPAETAFYSWYEDSIQEFRDSPLELPQGLLDSENRKPPVRPLRSYDLYMSALEETYRQRETSDSSAPSPVNISETFKADISLIFKGGHEAGIEIEVLGSLHTLPAIIVDLGANDSTLKESFAIWLQGARKARPDVTPKRSKPAFDRWARYGLLPYIDLLIWSIETETHIPDRVMSAAISHYDAGEANLRKTIAPLAADLMYDLSALQALVVVQASTRAPANSESFGS